MASLNPLVFLTELLPVWLVIGACVGSFLSMLAHRLPRMLDAEEAGTDPGMTLCTPASSCAHCGTRLRWFHNLPFIGFLLARKGAPCCGTKVPWRYLGFETSATLWAGFIWWQFHGDPLAVTAWSIFGWVLLVSAVIDWKTQWLPDVLTLPLLWAGLLFAALQTTGFEAFGGLEPSLQHRVLAVAGVYLVLRGLVEGYQRWRGVVGMGGGDIKLMAAFAAWLPFTAVVHAVLLSCLLQILAMAVIRRDKAAFGPSLCAAALVMFVAWRLLA